MPALTLDRTSAPALHAIQPPLVPAWHTHTLRGGLQVHWLRHGAIPVAEVLLVYGAGHTTEPKPGEVSFALRLMTDGTQQRNSLALQQALEQYGAQLNQQSGHHSSTLMLSSLSRHLPHTLPLLAEVARQATIPEDEFRLQQQRALQTLAVEAQKTRYNARRAFLQRLYGPGHPYATAMGPAEVEAISLDALRAVYQQQLQPSNAYLIVVGQFAEREVFAVLESLFGDVRPAHITAPPSIAAQPDGPGLVHVNVPQALQSTLYVGQAGFARSHPEYYTGRLTTLLFGGYFGSRLMQNIREEKGYTYGISAQWDCRRWAGGMGISTDVANEYVTDTLAQIRHEMQRMQQEPVGQTELDRARNYLMGRYLSGMETPDQMADILRMYINQGFDPTESAKRNEALLAATPMDLQRFAQQYYTPDALLEVVAGGVA